MPSSAEIRVLHVGKYYPPAAGGIETHVRTLAVAQRRIGLRPSVFCLNHLPGPTVREDDDGIPVTRFSPGFRAGKLEYCPEAARALREPEADLLHLQVPNPSMILAILRARPKIPVVVTYQSDLVRQKLTKYAFLPFERAFYRRVAAVFPTSPNYAAASEFLRPYADRIVVLPMGIELDLYLNPSPEARAAADRIRARLAPPVWVACGRLIYYKGLTNAIRALPKTRGTLVVVGDGPDRPALEAEAVRLGVRDRVEFAGGLPYREIVPYYLASRAFWFPSNARSEAFGLVQVEAMACGVPPINTAIPGSGVSWVSRHDESGLTIPVNDPDALAAAANRLADDDELHARLARGAVARAREHFDAEVMARRSAELYRDVLDGNPLGGRDRFDRS